MWRACEPHADQPVPPHWLPLVLGGDPCGWAAPDTASRLAQTPSPFAIEGGRLELGGPDSARAIAEALQFAARRLHEAGLVREWRSEQLDVWSADGRCLGTIERGACRPLGIQTRSVQLNAFRPDGSMLTAQRAPHKLSDPNRWDNLTGGMIAAGEQDHQALAREAYEEAGLQITGLPVVRGSRLRVQRMVPEGLMIETVQIFDVQVPAGFVPTNLDGEVAGFAAQSVDSVLDGIERGDFTLQASLAVLDALRRSAG